MKYNRILLKLSGEALMGANNETFSPEQLTNYANEIKKLILEDVEVAIVIGGGNIFRGLKGNNFGIDRIQGDYMGMLATIINSLGMQSAMDNEGIESVILSGLAIDPIAEKMSGQKANEYLDLGKVVIIAGGTGNPFFTTDSAAVLRALEINADVLLKGTRVDGVYSADPEKDPNATRFESISFDDALDLDLKIMDLTAFTLCKENKLAVIVFNMNEPGNLLGIASGEKIGTLVTS